METKMLRIYCLAVIILIVSQFSQASDESSVQDIPLLQPLSGELLSLDTHFQWIAINGVNEYQLEFFHSDNNALPIMTVTADTNEVYLPVLSRQKLQDGKSYLWQVVGLNDSEEVIAKSELRRFTVKQP